MCTVSHLHESRRLLVTMNRDERRERAPESPLRLHTTGPIDWMGPGDGESGGAWIGVNRQGVVACLLNGYPASESSPGSGAQSRGGIIPTLLSHDRAQVVQDWLRDGFDPSPYGAFRLLVHTLVGAVSATWDGERLLVETFFPDGWGMVTSSSWNQEAVLGWRREKFREWAREPRFKGELPTCNLLHETGREWWSPLVSRDMSATRSITQVEIRGGAADRWIEARYWPRPFEAAAAPDFRLRMPLVDGWERWMGRGRPQALASR